MFSLISRAKFTVIKRQSKYSLVGIESHNLKLKLDLDTIPYGFEEYSFSLKHPKVFDHHYEKIK